MDAGKAQPPFGRSRAGSRATAAAAGKADIGASDAFLSPATLAKYSHLVNIPPAVAALMVVYNVPGISSSAHRRLDGKVLGAAIVPVNRYLSQVINAAEGEVTSGTEQLGQVNFQPLPSSIVTLSDAQIAEIKG